MRSSDWSSDVCSADLRIRARDAAIQASVFRRRRVQDLAIDVAHFGDQIWIDHETAICNGRVTARHFQRREYRGAQRHCQIVRQAITGRTEARYVLTRVTDANRLQEANRHQIAKMTQRFAHAHRTLDGTKTEKERVGEKWSN